MPRIYLGPAIKRIRERQQRTIEDVARAAGMNKGNLSKIENEKQGYTGESLEAIAGALGVPVLDLFLEADPDRANVEDGPDLRGTVPLISWVQAGEWQTVVDHLRIGQGEHIATTYRTGPHTYALRVRGDSMEPKFPDGAILIVEPDADPAPNSFVIVRQNGDEATFKQLMHDGGRRYLKPLNPRYPILELLPDAVFCGVVKRVEMDV